MVTRDLGCACVWFVDAIFFARGSGMDCAVLALALAGTLFVNRLFQGSQAEAYKNRLHVVEDQLRLDGVGEGAAGRA